jgi:hypothetical protein
MACNTSFDTLLIPKYNSPAPAILVTFAFQFIFFLSTIFEAVGGQCQARQAWMETMANGLARLGKSKAGLE